MTNSRIDSSKDVTALFQIYAKYVSRKLGRKQNEHISSRKKNVQEMDVLLKHFFGRLQQFENQGHDSRAEYGICRSRHALCDELCDRCYRRRYHRERLGQNSGTNQVSAGAPLGKRGSLVPAVV